MQIWRTKTEGSGNRDNPLAHAQGPWSLYHSSYVRCRKHDFSRKKKPKNMTGHEEEDI